MRTIAILPLGVLLALNLLSTEIQAGTFTYQNPIATEPLRDPLIVKQGGSYYMTATCAPFFDPAGKNPGVKIWSSPDLLHWKFETLAVQPANWYQLRFWAPEIFPHDGTTYQGKYYLTFNCDTDRKTLNHLQVGLASSDKITGPYQVITTNMGLLPGNDADLFCDDDGKVYVFTSGIWGCEVSLETGKTIGHGFHLIQKGVPGAWDSVGIEAPFLLKHDGIYYLFYSSWSRGYEVGYATATNIQGPWTKFAGNPFYGAQSKGFCTKFHTTYTQDPAEPMTAAGHNCIFTGPDGNLWIGCHGTLQKGQPQLVIDPIHFVNGEVKAQLSWTPQTITFPDK